MLSKLHYPNPQFIRENCIDLNGKWQFTFDDENHIFTHKGGHNLIFKIRRIK